MRAFLILFLVTLFCAIFASESNSARRNAVVTAWGPAFYRVSTVVDTPQPPDNHFPNNPTGCPWKDEDEVMKTYSGDVNDSLTGNICLVADLDGYPGSNSAYAKLILGRVYAPKTANFSVRLTNDFGGSWNATSFVSGNQKIYQFCVEDSVADNANIYFPSGLTYWPLVPGTDGYGQIVNYTIHIQNLGSRAVKGSYGYFDVANNGWQGVQVLTPQIEFTPPSQIPCPPQVS